MIGVLRQRNRKSLIGGERGGQVYVVSILLVLSILSSEGLFILQGHDGIQNHNDDVFAVFYEGENIRFDVSDFVNATPEIRFAEEWLIDNGTSDLNSYPDIEPIGNGLVLIVWQEWWGDSYDVFFSKFDTRNQTAVEYLNLNPGDSEGHQARPSVAALNRLVYCVAWEDLSTTGLLRIKASLSYDGGKSFGVPFVVAEPSPMSTQASPQLGAGINSELFLVYVENSSKIMFSEWSNETGAFEPPQRISSIVNQTAVLPSLSANSLGDIFVVWADDRDGPFSSILFSRRLSNDTSFEGDRMIDYTQGGTAQLAPAITSNGSEVNVVWQDNRDGVYAVRFSQSQDRGHLFENSTVVGSENNTFDRFHTDVAASGDGLIVVAWVEDRPSNRELFYSSSFDGGRSFREEERVHDPSTGIDAHNPSVEVDHESNVLIAWSGKKGPIPDSHIYLSYGHIHSGIPWDMISWDFDANFDSDGDGNFTNDMDALGSEVTHAYGDNGEYLVSISGWEKNMSQIVAQAVMSVENEAPSVSLVLDESPFEGSELSINLQAVDPGSDDLIMHIDWGDGTSETETHYNNGIGPDPPNSSEGVYPFAVYSNLTHTYGDNGNFTIRVTVEDDDGGSVQDTAVVEVLNLAPEIVLPTIPLYFDEGEEFTLAAKVTDPGSDDIEFIWTLELAPSLSSMYYNDGVGPDPQLSPWGTFPFVVEETVNHTYGDDGYYNVTITATDDDGGTSTISFSIEVRNVEPAIDLGGPYAGDENSPIEFTATAVDPGSDDLTFIWNWGDGTTDAIAFYNDGINADPPKSPWGTYPFSGTHTTTHLWGDNGDFTVTLTVMDDDGAATVEQAVVTVNNVAPTITGIAYYLNASFAFRIAGEKWHNVEIYLIEDGTEVGYANITRYPGSPNDQMVTLADISIDFSKTYSAVAYYTPEDDPVNGQIWGATPAWVILEYEDGEERIHHTFNVRHEDTWTWVIDDLSPYFLGHNITFMATASDPGSDDLTFTWDWGDGNTTENVYYNDGVGPDPYPSPEVNPISVTDTVRHGYSSAGTYVITLTVTDDDGGVTSYSLNLTL